MMIEMDLKYYCCKFCHRYTVSAAVIMGKKKPSKRTTFYTVTEQPYNNPLTKGALICDCHTFRQTGKQCEHTIAAGYQRDFGDVSRYEGKF